MERKIRFALILFFFLVIFVGTAAGMVFAATNFAQSTRLFGNISLTSPITFFRSTQNEYIYPELSQQETPESSGDVLSLQAKTTNIPRHYNQPSMPLNEGEEESPQVLKDIPTAEQPSKFMIPVLDTEIDLTEKLYTMSERSLLIDCAAEETNCVLPDLSELKAEDILLLRFDNSSSDIYFKVMNNLENSSQTCVHGLYKIEIGSQTVCAEIL